MPDRQPKPMSAVPPSPPCAITRTSLRPLALSAAAIPVATAGALPNREWIHDTCHEVSGKGVENTSRQPVALAAINFLSAMQAADKKLIAANATGCLEVFSTPFPETSWQVSWIHSLFGNAPAVATGIAAALKAKGRNDVRVIAQGGDGGTADIGFGCLSGMFERNDDVLYICYDNQAYMNTGVQRSSATPPAARTATTAAVGAEPGNVFGQGKDLPRIAMAHGIPYVATATVAELRDLEAKVRRAMEIRGARYIHVFVPCPLGWGHV